MSMPRMTRVIEEQTEAEIREQEVSDLKAEIARLRAVIKRLEQSLAAAGRVLEPYYKRKAA
jgi:hypothetical protein